MSHVQAQVKFARAAKCRLARGLAGIACGAVILAGITPEARGQASAPSGSVRVASTNTPRAVLLHRYSFNEKFGDTCHDSVGSKDGKLMNGASFDGAGQVVLSNRTDNYSHPQFVALPPALITNFDAVTFEIWITPAKEDLMLRTGWERMWDFGNQRLGTDGMMVGGRTFLYSCIGNASVKPRSDVFVEGGANLWCISSQELRSGGRNHWVWTADRAKHVQHVFLNGVAAGTDTRFFVPSVEPGAVTNNWLGRSQFFRDPPLNGQIDEFRIYHGALDPLEVAANYQSGPDVYPAERGPVTALRLELTNSLAAGDLASAAVYATVSGLTNQIDLTSNPGLLISFLSADPSIARVDTTGQVFGVSAGQTEISASYGNVRASGKVRVAQHLSAAGEAPVTAVPGTRKNSPAAWLKLEGRCVAAGQFLAGDQLQDLMLPKPAVGRYFCLESLSAFDGLPYAAVADLDLLDDQGRPLSHEGWTIRYADSEERNQGVGGKENILDGDANTYWITQFLNASPNHPHRVVLDLGKSLPIAGFRYVPRRGSEGIQGRIKDYRVYVGNDLIEINAQAWALPARCYIFAYYQNNGADGLHLGYSLGGYRYERLDSGRAFLQPKIGQPPVLRDPCLFRQTNGSFGLVWTFGMNGNDALGYATSTNLMDWSDQRALPLMSAEPGPLHCWAPKACWDEHLQQYVILWASDLSNNRNPAMQPGHNRIYGATTVDFHNFGPRRLVYDPGPASGANDVAMLHANGRYYLWSGLPSGVLSVVSSDDPLGPFKDPHTPIEYGQLERPCLFRLGAHYALIAHLQNQNRYPFQVFTSPDLEHWEETTVATAFPEGANQGSVLEIPRETIRGLVEAGRLELGPTPAAAELRVGDWIWTTNVTDRQSCRLWRDFIVSGPGVTNAELRITADDTYVAYLDGMQVGHGATPNSLTAYDVTRLLSQGHHVLAVEAFNEVMDAGVLAGLHVDFSDGQSTDVLSDTSWRVADRPDAQWKTAPRPAASWVNAETVGYAGRDWWQYPRRLFRAPPLLPPVSHFWQRPWFVSLILGLLAVGLAFTLRQRLQLAVQNRSNRLLEDLVQQRTSELRRAQEHLEEQVTERTAELKQTNELLQQDIAKREQVESALVQARAGLEKASRATTAGELAASIAHEINQPLAGIVTSANAGLNWMAGNPPNLDKARESMNRVLRDGTRAAQVLERIRSLFRRSAPARASLNLNQVVRDVVALADRELQQQKIELSLKLADPLPAIMGDSIQLQQVLVNLIRNAVEAMAGTRERRLEIVSGSAEVGGNPAVSLAVSDTGVGFAGTEQERLFEAFHTTKPQGMGMGLWISRSIVEAHGGQLTVHANEGPGVTFQLQIPFSVEEQRK